MSGENAGLTADVVFEKCMDALTVLQSSISMLYKDVRRREDARAALVNENEQLRIQIANMGKKK